ncbi:MAG: hypothetical protein PVI90_01565 [Desulfobacteraceae bacterium]|jgi:hypothetical protein
MQPIKDTFNYLVLACLFWIFIHLFYYVRYLNLQNNYTIEELIIYGFHRNIVFYTSTVFLIILFFAILLIYRRLKAIVKRAKKQANQIRMQAQIEIHEIKTGLARQKRLLQIEYQRKKRLLELEYRRKNHAKSVELEAIRKKLAKFKKNQYDPRKQKRYRQTIMCDGETSNVSKKNIQAKIS